MRSPIDRIAKTPAVITQFSGVVIDGVPDESHRSCLIYEISGERDEFSEYGSTKRNKAVLVSINNVKLKLPASISIAGIKYDVSSITEYKSLSGRVYGYKLMLSGGE